MSVSTIWWLCAGALIAVELVTGNFYLLVLAVGLVAAALATHLGAGTSTQFVTAALVSGGTAVGWHIRQLRHPRALAAASNPDVNMDVGEIVHVDAWNPDGTASVKYRGANWTVMHRSGSTPSTGAHRVAEVIGSRLLVDKV